jgi:hypothetical protein
MASQGWREKLSGQVRVMQIIVMAMLLGCVFLGIIAVVMAPSIAIKNVPNMVVYLPVGFAVIVIIPIMVIPPMMVTAGRKKILQNLRQKTAEQANGTQRIGVDAVEDEAGRQLTWLLQSKLIVSAALLEGSILFLWIIYMITQTPLTLAVAGLMMSVLGMLFPNFSRSENWVEEQLKLLIDEV